MPSQHSSKTRSVRLTADEWAALDKHAADKGMTPHAAAAAAVRRQRVDEHGIPAAVDTAALSRRQRELVGRLVPAISADPLAGGDAPWTPDEVLFTAMARGLEALALLYHVDPS